MKRKVLLCSIATIALCVCLIAGSTFALFTTSTKVNIAVTAGELDIEANILEASMAMRSLGDAEGEFERGSFANGGSAILEDSVLKINQMTPGDAVCFEVKVTNTGDVAVQYNVKWQSAGVDEGKKDMFEALKITVVRDDGHTFEGVNSYDALGAPGAETTFTVVVEFVNGTPENDNQYQGAVANINFIVETVQQNGVDNDGELIR